MPAGITGMVVVALNTLAVCDENLEFGRRLCLYARQKAGYPFVIQAFSSAVQLQQFLQKKQPEAILLSEELYCERDWIEYDRPLFLLGSGIGETKGLPGIFRYQNAEGILQDVLVAYTRLVPDLTMSVTKRRFRLFAVTDVAELQETQALAWELAAYLARTEKVLWLNLRTWPSAGKYPVAEDREDLGQLLYYLCRRKDEVAGQLFQKVMSVRGIDLLPTLSVPADLLQVQLSDWKYLFSLLAAESAYTAVVVIVGHLLQPVEDVLELFDEVWIVKDVAQREAQERMERYLRIHGSEVLQQRMLSVQLPSESQEAYRNEPLYRKLVAKIMETRGRQNAGDGTETAAETAGETRGQSDRQR